MWENFKWRHISMLRFDNETETQVVCKDLVHDEDFAIEKDSFNADFLRKTIDGVHSLAAIYRFMEGDEDFVQNVRLLRAYRKLRLLRWPIRWAHLYTRVRSERSFLAGKSFSMTLFNFYKLGTFINTMHYENA